MKISRYVMPLVLLLAAALAANAQTAKFSNYNVSEGNVNVGSNNQKSISLTNTSYTTPLSISSLTISSTASPSPFTISGCTISKLFPRSSCNLNINFKPTAAGIFTGTITLNSSDTVNPVQTVNVTGTGIWATLNPSSLSFGSVNIGRSVTMNAQLKNAASTAMAISSITTSGAPFTITHNNCPQSLDSGSKCTISVTFTPTVAGLVLGTLTVVDDAGTQTTSLSGTGVAQTGIVVSPATSTISTGDSVQFQALPTYSDGTTGTTPVAATWVSSAPTVAQVDANGLTVGDAGGAATITATSGTFPSSGASVTVNGANACTTNNRIDAKLLVLTNGQTEADFPAIITTLSYLHMPYDVKDFRTQTVVQGQLYSGCHAFYNGVIMAFLDGTSFDPNANTYTAYDFSTIPPTPYPLNGFDVLQAFEKTFGIRQLNWFVNPAPALGFSGSQSGTSEGDTATYTDAAATIFPYVNQSNPLVIDPNAFVVFDTAGPGSTALLTDGSANALSLDYVFPTPDGREWLSNTFDSNQFMRHNIVLSYGLVNWVTKGLFVGEKHVFFTPQEDDWGIDDDIWATNTGNYLTIQGMTPPAVGAPPTCTNPSSTVTGMAYRINANDAKAFVNWQTAKQSNPLFTKVHLYNAFNSCGLGVNDPLCGSNGSPYPNDTLTAWTKSKSNSRHFGWINHTYEHEDLTVADNGTDQTYAVDYFQINQNILNEKSLAFTEFSPSYMVTPDISGLDFLPALQAMVDNGVQYVVSDTSCGTEKSSSSTCFAGTNNGPGLGFNLPIVNSNSLISPAGTLTGNIYEIPRRPSNLFYNVGTPDGWQSEYDCIYTNLGGIDPNNKPYGQYTTQDIKDFISGKTGVYPNFVDLMMQGDADPEMFHQTNLMAYDSTHSLLSDLLDESFNLYQSYFNLPVKSMDLASLGNFMLNNKAIDNAGVVATVNNGSSRTVTLSVTTPATIPVTGLQSNGAEQYGTQFISHVPMTAGETLTLQPAP